MFLSHFKLCSNHDLDDETGTQVSGYQFIILYKYCPVCVKYNLFCKFMANLSYYFKNKMGN